MYKLNYLLTDLRTLHAYYLMPCTPPILNRLLWKTQSIMTG